MMTEANAADKRTMQEEGFLVIPRLITESDIALIRDNYDRLLRREVNLAENDRMLGGLVRQILTPSHGDAFFADNPAIWAARSVAKDLLGCAEPSLGFDQLLFKEPGNTNVTPWHQDFAYWQMPFTPAGTPIGNASLQFWIALDDVDEENGCLSFVPGAHQRASLSHYVSSGDPNEESRLLATDEAEISRAVACPLPAGGCTVHYEGTPHFASGNHTHDRNRRGYILSYTC